VVSGINYGENVGTGITISGTVGAAMEAASMEIPALAVSLETAQEHHRSYSMEVDFSAAAFFTAYFARLLLEKRFPHDVDLLKVDVPNTATQQTPWQVTRLSRQRYYEPVAPQRSSWDVPGKVGYCNGVSLVNEPSDTDVYVLQKRRQVSVTPISLDMTARVDFRELERLLRDG
jgi:5'-nucleotidase